jgi:hypothetical protein
VVGFGWTGFDLVGLETVGLVGRVGQVGQSERRCRLTAARRRNCVPMIDWFFIVLIFVFWELFSVSFSYAKS